MQFIISTTDEVLLPQSGLALVGALLQSSKLRQIPSEPTLRQRLDAMRDACGPILREESALLVRKLARRPTPCHGEWVALDVDVSPFDNSGTKKEGVSWTYKQHKADWIIKRNLRKESLEDWLEEAQAHGDGEFPREGKEVYRGATWREREGKLYRVVFEVIRRTIHADGQKLLVPEIEVNTWWTSLRLPSGKFATNATMLSLGLVAYNVLRLCGQGALREQRRLPAEERAPLKKKVFRRRLRSVIQDLMYLAAQLVRHANRWQIVFWSNSPWGATWHNLYARFTGAPRMESG